MYSVKSTLMITADVPGTGTRKASPPNTSLQRTNQRSRVGCPIRRSVDQRLFAPPHGLSQRTTSFIASQHQGIHRMPFIHLITLIANAHHCGRAQSFTQLSAWPHSKRPASSKLVRQGRSHMIQTRPQTRHTNKSSLQYQRTASSNPEARAAITPINNARARHHRKTMVEPDGFEPTTPCLQSRCSPN